MILNLQKTKQRNTRTSVLEIIEFPLNQFSAQTLSNLQVN